jgi:exopolysaccharide biosynthesis protein
MVAGALVPSAGATDYDREVRPGITSFKRITGGSRPQNIYAVRADLSSPNIGLHASADDRGTEWYVDTLTFAENVDAIAAINGDWSCTTCSGSDYLHPLGLAISGGSVWNDQIATDTIGSHWGYLACTIGKQCDLTRSRPLSHASMADSPLQNPSVYPLRYQNAIGANGVVLLKDGVAGSGCFDSSSTNPRSAACVEADGTHLWLVVVDGRGAGGGTGMSCDDMRDLLLTAPFNCWNAVMLDGGGSSTLVVEDTNRSADCNPRGDNDLCVKNNPSDGSPRRVANHLASTWEDAADSRCAEANGKC